MSRGSTSTAVRAIIDDVFGRGMTRDIWAVSYDKVLPVQVQDLDLTGVLPAVFYMFRFGHRRGKGRFIDTFSGDASTAKERRRHATAERVAAKLAEEPSFEGFEGKTEQAILGDLLLSFCVENSKRALGRNQQIQRVLPTHYMASWVDLPERVAHLRYVPEMIVAILADQKGDYVEQTSQNERTWFAVGRGFEENLLLRVFSRGVIREGPLSDRKGDKFREEEDSVGLDQLLTIRLAQALGEAPDKPRGSEGVSISNQRPIAERAGKHFSEDIRRFVRAYAYVLPRHAFVELLESCMALGITTIVTSCFELLIRWAETGEVLPRPDQKPTSLFVDCSNGIEQSLRALAEESMDDFIRRTERIPVILMALRLLDWEVRYDPQLRPQLPKFRPYATEWVNLLGDILHERRPEATGILGDLSRKATQLAEALEKEDYAEAAEILRNDRTQPNPVWRLAEALTFLQGPKIIPARLWTLIDSALLADRPNGLGVRRAVARRAAGTDVRRRRQLRSVVLTDAVLDYLGHLHVLRPGNKDGWRPIAFREFLEILRDRYGLCVDTAPPGLSISSELLSLNRNVLERRLRDLGLLIGVNDAEAMKQLEPRFEPVDLSEHYDDGLH
jgi:hypothetical protein